MTHRGMGDELFRGLALQRAAQCTHEEGQVPTSPPGPPLPTGRCFLTWRAPVSPLSWSLQPTLAVLPPRILRGRLAQSLLWAALAGR